MSDKLAKCKISRVCMHREIGCVSMLLPGMNVVPIHMVPKPPDDKLHLVVDHSAGSYSINFMIDHQSIAGVKLDGIKSLGDSIRVFCASHPTNLSDMQTL